MGETKVTSTFVLVLVLTTWSGAVTQYLASEHSSLESCEFAGHSQELIQRPLDPGSQLRWYCMEKL